MRRMSAPASDLLLMPCSKAKEGTARPGSIRNVVDFLSPTATATLQDGRDLAFNRKGTQIDHSSPLVRALDLYTGYLYSIPNLKESIDGAIASGVHVLIISGGYGLLRAEEPIHSYEAYLPKTRTVWNSRLPNVIADYIQRNTIRRVFVGCFADYMCAANPHHLASLASEVYLLIQTACGQRGVPEQIGRDLVALVAANMIPNTRWHRV
jgi:hypothetical protein